MTDATDQTGHIFSWEDLFAWSSGENYGYVTRLDDALELVQEFSLATSTCYVETRSTKGFGTFDINGGPSLQNHLIRFQDDGKIKHGSPINLNGIPFVVVGSRLMECHQGPNHRQNKPSDHHEYDHGYSQNIPAKKITGSKKRGCSAAIYLREVITFPDYKLMSESHHHKQLKSQELRTVLESPVYDDVRREKLIYIDLPSEDLHSNHIMGQAADLKAPIDPRLTDNIKQRVHDGIFNVNEMKRHSQMFVESLFAGKTMPKRFNRRFFPSREDFRKIIYRERRKLQQGLLDQEFLQNKIENWKKTRPSDSWHFRPSTTSNDEGRHSCNSLLLVYQSDWQQKLLNRYGQEIVFLDATYRTTRYALPLFFLCVRTNQGYAVVATFVVEHEDSFSVGEALGVIKGNNSSWQPKSFMIDASEIEANAIANTFQDADIFICDFHRKQAWQRWTSAVKNGVAEHQEEILRLLNRVAESLTTEEFETNKEVLRQSSIWSNLRFRNYIMNHWLAEDKYKKWVWAFRNSLLSFVVNTNNGVEAQNKLFKYEYLAPFRVKALSGLMSTLVDNFFEDAHRKYLDANVTMSAGWREGMENIPVDFHHRPAPFIKHMRVLEQKSADITVNMVTEVEGGLYEVKSEDTKHTYSVFLGSEETKSIPSCTCRQFCKVHLPCKHFAAVFRHVPGVSWTSLPNFYRSHPIITVDDDCVNLLPPHTKAGEEISPSQSAINNHDCLKQATMINPGEDLSLHLASSAKSVREVIAAIQGLTYLVDSAKALQKAKSDLQMVANELMVHAPKTDGILLCDPPQKCTKRFRELPARKRRKQSSSGYKKQKTSHCEDMAPVSTSSLSVVTVAQIGVEKGASEFLDMIQVGAPAQAITLTQKGLRYYVHGEVLEDRDFQTLQNNNWFNDKVINAFLKKIMEDENRKSMEHVFVIPSYLAVLWENDQYGTWMYKKVKLSLYKWIFMPVNVNRNHWVLLVADVYKRTVSILDSLPTPGSSTLIEKWKKYMKLRASVAGELPDWEEGDLVSSKQCDGSSCGPFVLMNALAIVNNIPIQELNTDMATYMRQYVSSSLLQAAKQPPSQRSTCDMLGCCRPTSEKCWICCDVCGRWMHFSCININQSPEGDYVCPICIAQYE